MKIDLDNGLPVWVWGILFLLIVLPFSFRRAPDRTITPQPAVTLTVVSEPQFESVPTATPDPADIEIAPAPKPAGE